MAEQHRNPFEGVTDFFSELARMRSIGLRGGPEHTGEAVERTHASAWVPTTDILARGADLLIRFTGPELWWLLRVAHWASVPGASIAVPSGLLGVVTVAAAGLAAVVLWRWRWPRIGVCVAIVFGLAWTVSGLSGGHDTIVG